MRVYDTQFDSMNYWWADVFDNELCIVATKKKLQNKLTTTSNVAYKAAGVPLILFCRRVELSTLPRKLNFLSDNAVQLQFREKNGNHYRLPGGGVWFLLGVLEVCKFYLIEWGVLYKEELGFEEISILTEVKRSLRQTAGDKPYN